MRLMREWHREVAKIVEEVPSHLSLLRKMLVANPGKRTLAYPPMRDSRLLERPGRQQKLRLLETAQ